MEFWRWNESLSAAEIQELVVLGLLARTNQQSAGPNCSVFPVAQRVERRLQPDRRLDDTDPTLSLRDRRGCTPRRLYGAEAAATGAIHRELITQLP